MDSMINIPTQGNVIAHAPNTTVYLYGGVPWDSEYKDVRLYESKNDCLLKLNSNTKLSHLTIQNVAKIDYGAAEVNVPYSDLVSMGFNYMAIVDNDYDDVFNGKILFAFITGVKRRSRNSSRITFEYDVFQNNIYNVTFNTTFIERAHILKSDDVIGNFTENEGLEYGELISADKLPFSIPDYTDSDLSDWSICVASNFNSDGTAAEGALVQGIYTATKWYTFSLPAEANAWISSIIEKNLLEGIVGIYMAPTYWVDESELKYKYIHIPKVTESLDGYYPKNKKLFSYPYVQIHMNNNCGESTNLRQEFFSDADCIIAYTMPLSTTPKLYTFLQNYKGVNLNSIDSVNFNQFPQCSVAIDSYKAYLAQIQASTAVDKFTSSNGIQIPDTVKKAMQYGINTVQALGGGGSLLGNVFGAMEQRTMAYIQPPQTVGTTGGNQLLSINKCGIDIYRYTIRKEFAKKIDDFFTMFGYKLNLFGSPDYYMRTRSKYNFVKTLSCNISGITESDDLKRFKNIFDSGVTIWHVDDIGNYEVENE